MTEATLAIELTALNCIEIRSVLDDRLGEWEIDAAEIDEEDYNEFPELQYVKTRVERTRSTMAAVMDQSPRKSTESPAERAAAVLEIVPVALPISLWQFLRDVLTAHAVDREDYGNLESTATIQRIADKISNRLPGQHDFR